MDKLNQEGIVIISEIPITDFNVAIATLVFIGIVFLGLIIGSAIAYLTNCDLLYNVCIVLSVIGGLFVGFLYGIKEGKETGISQYEVQVDESVSVVDFYKNYKIISSKSDNVFIIEIRDTKQEATQQQKKDEINIKGE